jgi:F-type H+-transporting ATPase subunit b
MGDIAHSLDLNWGLIVTQIIGFLLTVWILKAFAWKPLLKLLEDRKKKIEGDIEDAEKIKTDAEKLLDDYNAKLRDIETEARSKIQDAVSEGNRIASEIRENAREEAHLIVQKSREELSRDIAKARVQLRNEMVGMAIAAAGKIISKNLDDSEQRRLLEDFLKEVE